MSTPRKWPSTGEVWKYSTRGGRRKQGKSYTYQQVKWNVAPPDFRMHLRPIYGNRYRAHGLESRSQPGVQGYFRALPVWRYSTPWEAFHAPTL